MGHKEPQATGKGGAFKEEKNERNYDRPTGDCASLSRLGSLGDCVEHVIRAGAYISFGRTTDGGSTLIRVLDGDTKLSSYCHSDRDLLEALEALTQRYKKMDSKKTLFTLTPPLKEA